MKGSNQMPILGSSSLLLEREYSNYVLLTNSRLEVVAETWLSNVEGSKLILALCEEEVESLSNVKEDEMEDDIS